MSLTKRAVAAGVVGATPTSSRSISLSQKKRGGTEHHAKGVAESKVALDRVLGLTCQNSNLLSSSGSVIAYPAGCVAVLFHPKKRKQVHIRNRKPISCLCVSPNGNYLATGERGHEPCVRVWDISTSRPTELVQLKGHNFGVACVLFSPNQKNLVSIGYQHDRQILVWNWKSGTRVVHGKFSSPVNHAAFSHNHGNRLGSNYFVTAHHRRVQYWYYDTTNKDGKKAVKPVLTSRSVLLGELQENQFVAVVCGRGPLSKNCYVLTKSGQLCLFDDKRRLDRFTEVKATVAHSLSLSDQYLFCGCSEGVVRIFDPYTLDYIITMPLPHTLGVNVAAPVDSSSVETKLVEKYPDSVALSVLDHKIAVVYNDHSFYIWDLTNIRQIGKTHSFLFHSSCVWDIGVYPSLCDDGSCLLPPSCFITCSSDNTVRFWCLDAEGAWSIKNQYSKELIRVLYSDPVDTSSLKDTSSSSGDAYAVADNTRGIRCIQIHPNGQHIATGDRVGNIRVYDLQFMDKIYDEVAHDSEILSLTYSPLIDGDQFLASASRDRMVHIFTCPPSECSYQPVQSLPDHSAAVTAVKFAPTKDSGMQLLSSGADKSIIFHTMDKTGDPLFQRSNHIVGKAAIYDMDVDPIGKHVLTAGQDKFLRIYLVSTGKQRTAVKAQTSDDGSLIKVSLDPSGLYAAASSADKSVVLFDVFSGECVAKLYGHSEIVTQVAFSQDCKYLYSVSGDSCIFVWRLSKELTQNMHERLLEMGRSLPGVQTSASRMRETYTKEKGVEEETAAAQSSVSGQLGDRDTPDTSEQGERITSPGEFELRFSQLPPWAQKQVLSRPSMADNVCPIAPDEVKCALIEGGGVGKGPAPLEGKWAERVGGEILFASQEPTDSDSEIMDLATEMTRVVSDQALDVVDLPEEEDNHSESPEASDFEEVLYLSKEQTDIDPNMFKVTTPPMFGRQCSEPEGESADEGDMSSPDNSPPLDRDKDTPAEDALFLKKNFESLEKGEGPFLQVPNPRLSISAKFLERNMRRHLDHPGGNVSLKAFGSPDLIEAAGIVVTVQDVNNNHKTQSHGIGSDAGAQETMSRDTGSDAGAQSASEAPISLTLSASPVTEAAAKSEEPLATSLAGDKEDSQTTSPLSKDKEMCDPQEEESPDEERHRIERSTSLGDIISPQQPKSISKRRRSVEEDIGKTRRRLEELGYIPRSNSSKDKDKEGEEVGGVASGTGSRKSARLRRKAAKKGTAEQKMDHPPMSMGEPSASIGETTSVEQETHEVQAEGTSSSIEEGEEEEPSASGGDTTPSDSPTSKAQLLLKLMEENLRDLISLNDQMMERITSEAADEGSTHKEVIQTIATGVNSLKSKLVNVANKNKKMWRAVAKNSAEVATPLSREQEHCDEGASPARYNLRSTPTRLAAAASSVGHKRNNKTTTSELQEEMSSIRSGTDQTEKTDHNLTQVSHRMGITEDTGRQQTVAMDTGSTQSEEPLAAGLGDQLTATVSVPLTDLERAKQMAQQLTALISNLEHLESSH